MKIDTLKQTVNKILKRNLLKNLLLICALFTLLLITGISVYKYYRVSVIKSYLKKVIETDRADMEVVLKLKGICNYEEAIELCNKSVEKRNALINEIRDFHRKNSYELNEGAAIFLNSENELVVSKKDIYNKQLELFRKVADFQKYTKTITPANSMDMIEQFISIESEIPPIMSSVIKSTEKFSDTYKKTVVEEQDFLGKMSDVHIKINSLYKAYEQANILITEETKQYIDTIKSDIVLKENLMADKAFTETLLAITDLELLENSNTKRIFEFFDTSNTNREHLINNLKDFYPSVKPELKEKLSSYLSLRNELIGDKKEMLETYITLDKQVDFCSTGLEAITSTECYEFSVQSAYITRTKPICYEILNTIPVLTDRADKYSNMYRKLLYEESSLSSVSKDLKASLDGMLIMKKYEEKNMELALVLKKGYKELQFNTEVLLDTLDKHIKLINKIQNYPYY
ncbi:MAG: hypothetical protein ABRQ39_32725 [Candidatus Eremiobacterota bacterium]